jgi:hypothetical protein
LGAGSESAGVLPSAVFFWSVEVPPVCVGAGESVCLLSVAEGCCARAAGTNPRKKVAANTASLRLVPARPCLAIRFTLAKDSGQGDRGCKGRIQNLARISVRMSAPNPGGKNQFCNPTTRNCIFSLDTTRDAAQNPRNFFRCESVSGGPTGEITGCLRGGKLAVFAGLDGAMYQSGVRGSRPLAAGIRLRRRTLQQLWRSAPQRSAAARPAPATASSLAG